eukprot:g26245.t1
MEPVCLPTATEASIPSRPAEHEGPMGPCYLTAETRPAATAFAASEIERLLKVNQDLQRVARAQAVAWPPSPERPSAGGPAKAWDAEAGPWPRASQDGQVGSIHAIIPNRESPAQEWLSSSPLRQSRLGSLYASPGSEASVLGTTRVLSKGGFPEASGTLSAEKEALASKLKAEERSTRMLSRSDQRGRGRRRRFSELVDRMCDVAAQTSGVNPKASRTSVDELLMTAARESANAPNRALKRRVRQRLHKKLGAILTLEEFERAKDRGPSRFRSMEEQQAGRPSWQGNDGKSKMPARVGYSNSMPSHLPPPMGLGVPSWASAFPEHTIPVSALPAFLPVREASWVSSVGAVKLHTVLKCH